MGHLPPAVEFAQRLLAHFPDQISMTFLIVRFTSVDEKVDSFIQSLKLKTNTSSNNDDDRGQITFLDLPFPEIQQPSANFFNNIPRLIDAYKPIIKQTLIQKKQHQSMDSPTRKSCRRLAGFVIDSSCSPLIDVAHELGIPSYIFYSSGASFLQIQLHFASFEVPDNIAPAWRDGSQQSLAADETSAVLEVAGFKNSIPGKVLPDMLLDKEGEWGEFALDTVRRYPEYKGILINTFVELEPHLIHSFIDQSVPTIYPVGPIINMKHDSTNNSEQEHTIMSWLDSQPSSSVVFLSSGSMAIFNETQLKEIAAGLERSGHSFLWSLKRKTAWSHGSDGGGEEYSESEYFEHVLPEGFLARTNGFGKVIGWAPQVSVLGHKAVGAFVSHCGWNSILESLWFGVPLITWPMAAEQQLNAFMLVHELGLAAEIRIDYKCGFQGEANMVVGEEEIEKGIRKVMDGKEEENDLREKVKRIREMGKNALLERSGSSYKSMVCFVEDVCNNVC